MDSRNGDMYRSRSDALAAGVPESALVEMFGSPAAVLRTAAALQAQAEEEKRLAKIRQRKRHANDHPPKVRA